MVTIQAKLKNKTDKNESLRNKGMIPAVFYGLNKQSTPISVDGKAFKKALHEVNSLLQISNI